MFSDCHQDPAGCGQYASSVHQQVTTHSVFQLKKQKNKFVNSQRELPVPALSSFSFLVYLKDFFLKKIKNKNFCQTFFFDAHSCFIFKTRPEDLAGHPPPLREKIPTRLKQTEEKKNGKSAGVWYIRDCYRVDATLLRDVDRVHPTEFRFVPRRKPLTELTMPDSWITMNVAFL